MQSGLLKSGNVSEWTSTVLVNGVPRQHSSWSDDREISSDLPAQVVAGSGVTQAAGSVIWTNASEVSDGAETPWNRQGSWLPSRGDNIVILESDGAEQWQVFSGVIDKTTGTVGGQMVSTIIDKSDAFSAQVTHEPMLPIMPPHTPGGSYRGVGLAHTYFVDSAFRAAGFFVTPGQEHNSVLHVPGQGSIWPHRGTCLTASNQSGVGYPLNGFASWGFAVGDARATYLPEPIGLTSGDPIHLTMVVASNHAGVAQLRANFGSAFVVLEVSSSRVVSLNIGGTVIASFTLPAGDDVVQALVKGGVGRVRSRSGRDASGVTTFGGTAPLSDFLLSVAGNGRIAGVQASSPGVEQEWRSLSFQPNARINTSDVSLMGIMEASPAIVGKSASSLLDEMSKATLSCYWLNELGVAQWWPGPALRGRPASRTITTLDDVLSLDWEDSILASASKVTVTHEVAAVSQSKWQSVRVWQGSNGQLESEENSTDFVEPPAGEAWLGVDDSLTRISNANWSDYNPRRGSFAGCYFTLNGDRISESGLDVSITMAKLGPNKYLVKHFTGVFPANVTANLSTPEDEVALWSNRRGESLPDIGAHARVVWSESSYSPVQAGGVGPELVHSTGHWIPETHVPDIASYLISETSLPEPVITGLDITPDPRLQLGDVITISSTSFLGIELTAVVFNISRSHGDSGFSQSLGVRVVGVERLTQTFAEFDDTLPNPQLTFAQWQALGPIPQTFEQFNNG